MKSADTLAIHRHRRRTLFDLLGAAVLGVMTLMGYLIWSGYQEAIHSAQTTSRNYAATIEARLDATLRRADAIVLEQLRTIPDAALNKQAFPRYAREIDAMFDAHLINFPELASLRVFAANGELLYTSAGAGLPSVNIADRDEFRRLRDNPRTGLVLSEARISRITGRPSLFLFRALRDAQGAFRGVVSTGLDLDYFQKLFQTLDLGAHGVMSIYRSDTFTPVVRWPVLNGRINAALPPSNPARGALTPGIKTATVEFAASSDGVVRIYSSHVLDRYPFFVTAGLARGDVLAGWKQRSLVVGLSGLLLLGLLAILLLRLWLAERRQTQASARLAAIVDYSNDAIISRDLGNQVLTWNAAAEQLFEYTASEAVGRDISFIVPPDREAEVQQRREALFDDRVAAPYDTVCLAKNGRLLDLSITQSPIKDIDGKLIGASITLRDISKRKLAEQAQQQHIALIEKSAEQDRLLRLFYELPFVGLAVTSPTSKRWLQVNDRMCEMLGYTREELLESDWTQTTHPDDLPGNLALFKRMVAGELDAFHYDKRFLHKDGRVVDTSMEVRCVRRPDGSLETVVIMVQDITERKALEARLLQSQKMEAVGTLAGGIAHDFNNVLGAIIGNVELARQDVGEEHPARESIESIRKSSQRAKALVDQILTFSRQQPLPRHALELAPVIKDAVNLMRATLPAGIELSMRLSEDTLQVLADPTQLHQVIVNLCANAWQAMDGKGRIDLRMEGMKLEVGMDSTGLRPGQYAYLSVRDTGCGMDAATQARIFEPFFTTRAAGKGTGLGLSVVHGIVEGYKGAIRVESAPGGGTTFHLYFPTIEASAETIAPKAEIATPQRGRGQHVLYLDDEEDLVIMVARLLERLGYRVSGYTNAKEAVAAVRADAGRFDLVVTDYNMPGMSGLDVADELALIRRDLPVAMISGHISDELRQKAPASGVQHLIYKPNTVEELCDAVHSLTQREIRH